MTDQGSSGCDCHRPTWAMVRELVEMERRACQRAREWDAFLARWDVVRALLGDDAMLTTTGDEA